MCSSLAHSKKTNRTIKKQNKPPGPTPPHASTHRQTSQRVSFSSLFRPSIGVVPAEVMRFPRSSSSRPPLPRAHSCAHYRCPPISSLGVHLPSRLVFFQLSWPRPLGTCMSFSSSIKPKEPSRAVLILPLPCLLDDAICSRAQRAPSTG